MLKKKPKNKQTKKQNKTSNPPLKLKEKKFVYFCTTQMDSNDEDNSLKTVPYCDLFFHLQSIINQKPMTEKPGSSETASRDL